MRVLYLGTDLFNKGGIERYSRYQIRSLREGLGPGSVDAFSLNPKTENAFEEPIEVAYSGGPRGPRSKLSYSARALWLAATRRHDIVLSAHISLATLAVAAARLAGGRSVLNVYGLEMWTGLRPRDRAGLERIDHVISDCHFTARYVTDELGIPADRLSVTWDCVDLERFVPAPPDPDLAARYGIPLREGELRLMTLGRVTQTSRHKGYERMLEVVAGIPDEIPVLYVIAGSGDFVDTLRGQAEERGIANRVVFTGSIHEDDLAAIYHCCDLFCLVSDRGEGRGEGIPLTPLEAAACGIPILVGNHDGSQEAVVEGENGYVLDPFDIQGIRDKILLLAGNPELRRRLGEGALRRVKQEHALPIFQERTLTALRRALGGASGDHDGQ